MACPLKNDANGRLASFLDDWGPALFFGVT